MTSRQSHKFQPPKGTRDFFPAEMAVRRYIESVWREVSINHGFDEIDGPTFEHLDLYTVKSGQEIVSELFSFRRSGGDTDYALRPEFTPTLARMYAANANALPKPTNWFCIPNFFRAERPQRGRLREFYQWNIDIIGDDSPRADAEIIACTVDILKRLGLKSQQVTIKISHRGLIESALQQVGVQSAEYEAAMSVLDRVQKLPQDELHKQCHAIGLDLDQFNAVTTTLTETVNAAIAACEQGEKIRHNGSTGATLALLELIEHLDERGVLRWCECDLSIVRGLAYYTGTVFEVHEASGKERAIAGGGRYDKLIELFGGPPTSAVGIAMGDVVIRLVLEDLGLLDPAETYLPRPDVFIIAADKPAAQARFQSLVSELRGEGLHVRHSYKATKNIGKLLKEADKARARIAVILGDELDAGNVVIKDLDSGEQRDIPQDKLLETLLHKLGRSATATASGV